MGLGIVDYGMGNIGSVRNMCRRIGVEAALVRTHEEILQSERVLLPGVGSFDGAVSKLRERGIDSALKMFASTGRPILGICLGMQLLMTASDEGVAPGLGLIRGTSRRFPDDSAARVPHMAWNKVLPARDSGLFAGLDPAARFYFVHSYYVVPEQDSEVLATSFHGQRFASMVQRGNIFGAQFHPEKSHTFGMQLLRNFAAV